MAAVASIALDEAINEVVAANQDLPGVQNGLSVYLLGNKLYFGRQSTPGGPELYIYDTTNPLNGLPLLGSKDINTGVEGIRVTGKFAFLATPKVNKEFQIWNITNAINPTLVETYTFKNLIPSGIDYDSDFVNLAGQTLTTF